jgi:hypothetical protein
MGRVHRHRFHVLDLVSPTPGRVLFGAAVTISYFPSRSVALDPHRDNFANDVRAQAQRIVEEDEAFRARIGDEVTPGPPTGADAR